MNKIIVAYGLLSLLFSCKKYDEGPCLILSSKISRIEGTWDLEYIYVNNIDSTFYAKNQLCNTYIGFNKDRESNKQGEWVTVGVSPSCGTHGDWSFSKDKSKIIFYRDNPYDSSKIVPIGPFMAKGVVTWNVNRLTKNELWMDTNFNGHFCWVHFKKVNL